MMNELRISNEMDLNVYKKNSPQANASEGAAHLQVVEVTDAPKLEKKNVNLSEIVETANSIIESFNKGYKFKYNENADRYQVSIVNKDTGEVLKELPPDDVIKLVENLHENLSTIFDQYR